MTADPLPPSADVLIDGREAARRLGLSPNTLRVWRLRGVSGPPHIKLGRRSVRYRWADIQAWLEARRVAGGA